MQKVLTESMPPLELFSLEKKRSPCCRAAFSFCGWGDRRESRIGNEGQAATPYSSGTLGRDLRIICWAVCCGSETA